MRRIGQYSSAGVFLMLDLQVFNGAKWIDIHSGCAMGSRHGRTEARYDWTDGPELIFDERRRSSQLTIGTNAAVNFL